MLSIKLLKYIRRPRNSINRLACSLQDPLGDQLVSDWSRLVYEAATSDEATDEFLEAVAETILANVDLLRPVEGKGEGQCFFFGPSEGL